MRTLARSLLLAAVCALAAASRASAQQADPRAAEPRYPNLISVQPLWTLFELYSGDYERLVGRAASVGVNLSYDPRTPDSFFDGSAHSTYFSGEVKLRAYPERRGRRGLSLGVGVGAASLRRRLSYGQGLGTMVRQRTRPTVGGELAYNAILDDEQRIVMSTGIGLKWHIGPQGEDDTGLRIPLRLAFGLAF